MANPKDFKKERARKMMSGEGVESKFKSNRGEQEIVQLEKMIDDLELAYKLFFNGIVNIDPTDKRARVTNLIARLHEMKITNPRIKFKLQSLLGRWVTLKNYWDRILKEMERGTYRRDVFRAEMREKLRQEAAKAKESDSKADDEQAPDAWNIGADADSTHTTTSQPSSKMQDSIADSWNDSAASQPAKKPVVDKVYEEVLNARKSLSQPPISKEKLSKTIQAQAERVKKKYKCDDVDFKVEVREGKVVLKPIPIRRKS